MSSRWDSNDFCKAMQHTDRPAMLSSVTTPCIIVSRRGVKTRNLSCCTGICSKHAVLTLPLDFTERSNRLSSQAYTCLTATVWKLSPLSCKTRERPEPADPNKAMYVHTKQTGRAVKHRRVCLWGSGSCLDPGLHTSDKARTTTHARHKSDTPLMYIRTQRGRAGVCTRARC